MYRRPTKQYPSVLGKGCHTHPPPKHQYSGEAVMGIALLHKQAYAPVTAPIKTDPKRQ